MSRRRRASVLITAAVLATAAFAGEARAVGDDDLPSYVTASAFTPIASGIANRPQMLLETDYYVYGAGILPAEPDLVVSIDRNGYDQPATMYLFWENRNNGQRQYYNVGQGLTNQEVDLFGAAGSPAQVLVPSLSDFRLFGPDSAFGSLPAGVPRGNGLYQFVLEVRDAAGTRVIARSNAMYNFVGDVVNVSGNLAGGNWTNDKVYYLAGPTRVTSGTLNIQAGTVILGSQAGQGVLIVRPGARIQAVGDAMRPIVFSSENERGDRAPGDWGGLAINGNAPVNIPNPVGEGDSGTYGGNDPNDSSGRLSYVRVEFAGIRFNDQDELNGIALQGVGAGTQLDHLQIHYNQDDGIEFFGGTANAKYVLVTNAEDDSLDWTFGWQGNLQFFVAIQTTTEAGEGIEADGQEQNPNATPRSNPTLYNATFVGNRPLPGSDNGSCMNLRRGTSATIRNFVCEGFSGRGVNFSTSSSPADASLSISNGIVFDVAGGLSDDPSRLGGTILTADPRLPAPYGLTPDVAPLPGSPARGNANVAAPPAGFFDAVNFLGGVNPNDPWIHEGWTTFSDN
ncbi:MAG TPA: hypothetical protein VHQ65_13865 [Thermoanaerobaculia bacterium]|nr:hypothetical protein [Thermoanaerobaculia bacterium]